MGNFMYSEAWNVSGGKENKSKALCFVILSQIYHFNKEATKVLQCSAELLNL